MNVAGRTRGCALSLARGAGQRRCWIAGRTSEMIGVVLAGSVVAVLLVTACVLGGWRIRRGGRRVQRVRRRWILRAARRAPGPAGGRVGRRFEARLVARLLDGDLAAGEYRDAMAVLAADDAVRHPVVVPER